MLTRFWCWKCAMLNTRHAHPFTIILGVENQSEATAVSRYPFSGGQAECEKLSWYMWCCFCFRAFVLVVGKSKYCFMAQQVSTCHFSTVYPVGECSCRIQQHCDGLAKGDWEKGAGSVKDEEQALELLFQIFSQTVTTLLLVLGLPWGKWWSLSPWLMTVWKTKPVLNYLLFLKL